MIIWVGHVARLEKMKNAYRHLVKKLQGKRPSGRQRRKRKDTEINIREIMCERAGGLDKDTV